MNVVRVRNNVLYDKSSHVLDSHGVVLYHPNRLNCVIPSVCVSDDVIV